MISDYLYLVLKQAYYVAKNEYTTQPAFWAE